MYHDDQLAAASHRDAVLRQLGDSAILEKLPRIYAARMARIAFGVTGLLGVLALVLRVAMSGIWSCPDRTIPFAFPGIWAAMLLITLPVYGLAYWRFRRWTDGQCRPTDDAFADLDRLGGGLTRRAVERLTALEVRSFGLPLAAIGMLAPLSIHLVIYALFLADASVTGFTPWVGISSVLTGHVHVAVVITSLVFARRMVATMDRGERVAGGAAGVTASLVAAAVSLLPGALLVFIPPVLVLFTGLLFLPLAFRTAARIAQRERADLDEIAGGSIAL